MRCLWVASFGILGICAAAIAADRSQTPVILISIDTLRADHLSAYGYRRLSTAHIDSLAKGGTLFSQAAAQIPLTRILLQKKEYEQARSQFKQLLKIQPANFTAHYNLGWLATMQDRWDEGERHLKAAVKADAANATPHDALGNLYLKRGDLDRAQAELQEAVKLTPKDAWGHYSLGIVYVRKNQNTRAVMEFRQALDADSSMAEARAALDRLEKSKP